MIIGVVNAQTEATVRLIVLSEIGVPKEIDFSSYECDCGHQSHFFANTIEEAKAMSRRRTVRLGDSEAEGHTIVFEQGKMVDILCPKTNCVRQSRRKSARRGK